MIWLNSSFPLYIIYFIFLLLLYGTVYEMMTLIQPGSRTQEVVDLRLQVSAHSRHPIKVPRTEIEF